MCCKILVLSKLEVFTFSSQLKTLLNYSNFDVTFFHNQAFQSLICACQSTGTSSIARINGMQSFVLTKDLKQLLVLSNRFLPCVDTFCVFLLGERISFCFYKICWGHQCNLWPTDNERQHSRFQYIFYNKKNKSEWHGHSITLRHFTKLPYIICYLLTNNTDPFYNRLYILCIMPHYTIWRLAYRPRFDGTFFQVPSANKILCTLCILL